MIRRYHVCWVNLDPTIRNQIKKTRPCVVVSPDEMRQTGLVVVCPLTSSLHPGWAHRLQITCAKMPAEIMPVQIRSVSVKRIGKFIDKLSPQEAQALHNVLGCLYAST